MYLEIIESIEQEYDRLNLDENISSLVKLLFASIQENHERHIVFLSSRDDRPNIFAQREWMEYVDWEISSYYESRWHIEIYGIRLLFEYGLAEQGVQHVMFLMLYSSGFLPDCAIVIAAAIGDEARDSLINGLVERIFSLKHGGFDIYMEYIEMLTDPRRVFDPITKEVQNRIIDLMRNLNIW